MEHILTSQSFDDFVSKADKPLLIDFWATWCGPCKMVAPHLEEIANECSDILVCKVNVDEEPSLAEKFGIQYIPTLIVMKNAQELTRASGYKTKEEILSMAEGAK